MKPKTTLSQNFNSAEPFTIGSESTFINEEIYAQKSHTASVMDLYQKHNDEPDFDCEFLQAIGHNYSENIIDIETEEEQTDDYNDTHWDAAIYDPYLESNYY
ncbi:hypothetical protein [Flavobacterium anhuiense]|uniref:hypothetical protein n=1 Tax=Flavobacterium anhuiense TaxID=459526 RepID=UPI003D9974B3